MRCSTRLHLLVRAIVVVAIAAVAAPALAQTGRVGGVVKDETGQPIKGATVTAENPSAVPNSFTSTTDDKGRFSIIGMKSGMWTFTAMAPGYVPSQGRAQITTLQLNPPIEFRLAKGAVSPAGGLAGVDAKELQAELQVAENFFNAGQYDEAIAGYQAVLAKAPMLTAINLQIGLCYQRKKDFDKAIAAYQEVLKANPNNEKAKIAIGMANLDKGDLEAAEVTLAAAAEGLAASREVFYNLGEVKFAKGQPDEAAKWYQRAVDTDPSWGKPLFKLGLVALNKGDKDGAIKHFEKVMEADPASAEAAQAKAVIEQLKK